MRLHDAKRGTKIYCDCSDGSSWVKFNRVDGMYSNCTTEKGGTVHPAAFMELTEHLDGWKFTQ